jgi:hypothetical protein
VCVCVCVCTSHVRASELLRHTRFGNEEEEEDDSKFLRNSGNLNLNRVFYSSQYHCVI